MAQPVIQQSFNSGEWAPNLWGRVDLEKYHSGAALLKNFFVDYRGGASTRSGTKYVLQANNSVTDVHLIPFQASLDVRYILEFGNQYIRFHQAGAPVLETPIAITAATKANPCVISVANSWTNGDWIYITGVGGMTELNGKYYIITNRTAGTVELLDLFSVQVNSTSFGTYTVGGTAARVYTISSPYSAADLDTLKFTQNVNTLFICHPSYAPRTLTYTSATSWALTAITFGTTISAPTNLNFYSTLTAGTAYYSYIVTAVDGTGQESAGTTIAPGLLQDIRTVVGTNYLLWDAVTGAVSYNVYRADVAIGGPVPSGSPHGYIGNFTGIIASDSNIAPDFSEGPPIPQQPFATGVGVQSASITAVGSYTVAPTATFAAPVSGVTATGDVVMSIITAVVNAGGAGYVVGDYITVGLNTILQVTGVAAGAVTTVIITTPGYYDSALPATPVAQIDTTGAGAGATFDVTWGVLLIVMTNNGSGYTSVPAVTFSAGAATATAVLGAASNGNPEVPAFFQQRFVLAATASNPQALFMSRPGAYYNFDTTNPIQTDDAIISASIVSGQLNNIKALIPQPGGLIVLTDGASFLVNGGSSGEAIGPDTISVNAQSFLGCNDMPPIVVNYDILYVQSKGSSVRDASYNFYANVFTGTDISIISSHLFFGYELTDWAWAEEPYKIIWAVRNDGALLSLTFLKEQEFSAWAQHDTDGDFKSVASIVEPATVGYQNFVYFVVERVVQGQTLKYIEYFPERLFTDGVEDAVTVDCCYQYSGSPATTFSGATALAGLEVTGLADGVIISAFTMPANGSFTLATAASKVTVGIAFTPQLQTLYLDTKDPTIQSKMKKIPVTTIRVVDTLGLQIGTDFDNLVDMKDLVRGNVGSMTNEVVTDLVTGDARTFLDPKWQEQGVFCIEQPYPYPATILAVVPQLTVGDTPK